ncbi:glycosyltransferase [Mobiluncus porci]|uniref:Glycosyltransferase n=1 Tax=Mobiluncus porci TaxID=2652278 RepID=A0A7K0K3J9_9ACTO|nr:glycosyltransferase [Mobiluncus porci]MST50066.1 glycosyltransferase [Mobiluncus porci]
MSEIPPQPLAPLPNRPRLGVAMTTHNGSRFVKAQIRSILSQDLPVDEIVIGDDDSTDNTVESVQQLVDAHNAATDHPVTLVWRKHRPALGIRDNFSDAISATSADVVFLSDQDDEWAPHKTTVLTAELADTELVHTDAILIDAEGAPLGSPERPRTLLETLKASTWEITNLTEGNAFPVLLKRNLITGATVAMRGDFARENMPVPAGLLHDEWLAMMAALEGRLRLAGPETAELTRYRQHGGNAIGAKRISLRDRFDQLTSGSGEDNLRRLTRAKSLATSAQKRGLGTPAARRDLLAALRHQEARGGLPPHRLARIPKIAKEILNGHYFRYSRGWLTVIRDLFAA